MLSVGTIHGNLILRGEPVGGEPPPPPQELEQPPPEPEPYDPTVILNPIPKPQLRFAEDLIRYYSDLLQANNLLVLTCFDTDVLFSAGLLVATRLKPHMRSTHLLTLDIFDRPIGDDETHKEVTLDTLLHDKLSWHSPTLLLVAATSLGADRFVSSVGTGLASVAARNTLLHLNRFLLLLTTPDLVSPSDFLPCQAVPFVEPRIGSRYAEEASEWTLEIERQRKAGLWGENDRQFWETFEEHFRRGTLEQAIACRRSTAGRIDIVTREVDTLKVDPNAELENTILFFATFFPSIPLWDLHEVLTVFLGGKVKKVKRVESDPDDEENSLLEEEVPFLEIWHESYDAVLKECGLLVRPPMQEMSFDLPLRAEPRGPVVEFEVLEQRDYVRRQFLVDRYVTLESLLKQVRRRRLLLASSPPVLEGTLRLTVTVAAIYPQRHGLEVLQEILDLSNGPKAQIDTEDPGSPWDKGLVLSRLYLLIRAFLRESTLKGVVDRFLNGLIGGGRHNEALELVKRLRFASEFDQVYWWKQLLDRGSSEARERTYEEMLATLRAGGSELPGTLRRIGSWLPDEGAPSTRESTERANQLLFELFQDAIRRSRFRQNGIWPPTETVYLALCDPRTEMGDLPVWKWLAHPSFTSYLQRDQRHYPNLVVWTWLLNPVRGHLLLDAKVLGRNWYFDLAKLPKSCGLRDESCVAALQALILADLSLSLDNAEIDGHEDVAFKPLADIVRGLAGCLRDSGTQLLVDAYWSAMRHRTAQLLTFPPGEGVTMEDLEKAQSRLRAQYRSLGTLLELFRKAIRCDK